MHIYIYISSISFIWTILDFPEIFGEFPSKKLPEIGGGPGIGRDSSSFFSHLPSLKPTAQFAPENPCLEDDPASFWGPFACAYFSGAKLLAVSFREWHHPKLLSHVNRWVGLTKNGLPSDQVIRSSYGISGVFVTPGPYQTLQTQIPTNHFGSIKLVIIYDIHWKKTFQLITSTALLNFRQFSGIHGSINLSS